MAEQLPLDFTVSATQRHRRAVKATEEAEQLDLFSSWVWSPNIDIHLDGPDEAVASIAGKEPERAHDWLAGIVGGNLSIRKARQVAFPVQYLDRFLHLRPPAQVTLDAAAAAVGRALWAKKLDLKPLRVVRDGRRLTATSARRWPMGFAIKDVPWNAIVSCVHLDLPLEIDETAEKLFARRLQQAGAKVATSGLAGSAVTIETSRPELVERLGLPGLAYDGATNIGKYRLPLLSAEPLLRQQVVNVPHQVEEAIKKATRPIKPLTGIPEPFPWTLYDFQAADAGRGLRILETTGGVLLAGDMGSGKLCPASQPVVTPTGWVPHGKLAVGDPIMGVDGRAYEVTGVFPQGVRDIYRLTFTDGTSTLAGDEHLWAVQSAVMKKRGRGFKVKSTAELLAEPLRDGAGNLRWYIPMAQPQQFPGVGDLPLDPYVLGCLIGDGGLGHCTVGLTSADPEVVSAIRDRLPDDVMIRQTAEARGYQYSIVRRPGERRNSVQHALREVGLMGKRAWEKSIPEEYLWAPLAARIELLQGLLDTDGGVAGVSKPSSIEYSTTSPELKDNVVQLVQSLGGTARVTSRYTTYPHAGEKKTGRLSWRISIALPNEIPPFKLPRKRDAYSPRVKYLPSRGIKNIEYVGAEDAVCIAVSAPDHLYMTNDFLATHNTTVSLALAQYMDLFPLLVVSPLSAFSTWARQLGEMNRNYYMATGSPAKAWEEMENGNYEAVVMSFDRVGAFVELIERLHFKAVIADEIQRIRTPGSKRSRAMRQIAGALPYRIGLSGTPLTNTVQDVLPLGSFLVPGEWKPRAKEKDLEDMYPGDPTEALAEHLGSIMVRRRIDQVGRPMPKRNDHRVYIQLTPEQRKALADLEAEAEAAKAEGAFDDNSGRMHAFARLQKMRQIINSPRAAGVAGPNPKVNAAIDMAKEFLDQKRKGVIFCADRTTFKDIGKALDAEGIGWVGIWGSTPPQERIENERKFHAGDPAPNGNETSVVVCTIQAGAESWSASPTGTWLISTAYVYAPSTLAQMEARVHRLNSALDGPEIEIMYIHSQGVSEKTSLDDRMVQILELKKHLFAQVIDRQTHTDNTKVHYSMGDLVYLLTGERDEQLDVREADAKAVAAREKAKKDHAKRTLYGHKARNKDLKYGTDDGSITHTLEEYRAAHPELADVDDLDALVDAADHLDNFGEDPDDTD